MAWKVLSDKENSCRLTIFGKLSESLVEVTPFHLINHTIDYNAVVFACLRMYVWFLNTDTRINTIYYTSSLFVTAYDGWLAATAPATATACTIYIDR